MRPPVAPTSVTVTVTSTPGGAGVFRADDDVRIGATPLEVRSAARQGEIELVLRHPGYREERIRLSTEHDATAHVPLVKIGVQRRPSRSAGRDAAVPEPSSDGLPGSQLDGLLDDRR